MATAWDTTLYPLRDTSTIRWHPYTKVDVTAGGAIHNRIMSSAKVANVGVRLAPLNSSDSVTLSGLIFSATPTEWIITVMGIAFTGYINTGTASIDVTGGVWYNWSFDFIGDAA